MEKLHLNERGRHTTVIEVGVDIYKFLKKLKIDISPGKIEPSGGSGGKSVKIKKINGEVSEMVIVGGSTRQTFKVFTENPEHLVEEMKNDKKIGGWNINFIDISQAHK